MPTINNTITALLIVSLTFSLNACVQIAATAPKVDENYDGKFGYVMGSVGGHPWDQDIKVFFAQELTNTQPLIITRKMGKPHFIKQCGDGSSHEKTYARAYLVKAPVGEYFFSSYHMKVATGIFHTAGPYNRLPYSSTFEVEENTITYIGRFTGTLSFKEGTKAPSAENVKQLYVSVADKYDDDLAMVKQLSSVEYRYMNLAFPQGLPIKKSIIEPKIPFLKQEDVDQTIGSEDCSIEKMEINNG